MLLPFWQDLWFIYHRQGRFSLIHQYFLSAYLILSIVPSTEDITVKRSKKMIILRKITILQQILQNNYQRMLKPKGERLFQNEILTYSWNIRLNIKGKVFLQWSNLINPILTKWFLWNLYSSRKTRQYTTNKKVTTKK